MFADRAEVMEWLSEATAGGRRRLWGVNEAEICQPDGEPALVAWFQATADIPPAEPFLPIAPFVACIESVMTRAGQLNLTALEMAVPVQLARLDLTTSFAAVLAAGRDFLSKAANPRAACRVTISLHLTTGDKSEGATVEAFQWIDSFQQDVLSLASVLPGHDSHLPLSAPKEVWNKTSEPAQALMLEGTLREWSFDAIAWSISALTYAVARCAPRATPILIRVAKRQSS
jgi:hypothetical protein